MDCEGGEDESPLLECPDHRARFDQSSNTRLASREVEQWTNRNLQACLSLCINAKDFTCRGVNHHPADKFCVLLEFNVGLLGTLEQNFEWNYYERLDTAVVCPDSEKCDSGKCLNSTQFCDGVSDCPDRKDEAGCPSSGGLEVRLVGGREEWEGRVEVRGHGAGWAGVCDDGWGAPEASVVCRMAGYRLGAREAVLRSRFGSSPGGNISLDEVDCTGEEDSLMDCKFNPWGVHDCSEKEFAGVVCIDEAQECGEDEWRCGSGECRVISGLCDTVEDCQDGSDEERTRCDSQLAVRLVGGNNVTSGRLEVRNHGVWGSVCDDEFGPEEGSVVCRMLGLPGPVNVHSNAAYGQGQGPIWIKTIECRGNETDLKKCPGTIWEHNYYCKHSEDVGLECLLTEDLRPRGGAGGGGGGDDGEVGGDGECGVAEITTKPQPPVKRVAGGQTAAPGSQPWTASSKKYLRPRCEFNILSSQGEGQHPDLPLVRGRHRLLQPPPDCRPLPGGLPQGALRGAGGSLGPGR